MSARPYLQTGSCKSEALRARGGKLISSWPGVGAETKRTWEPRKSRQQKKRASDRASDASTPRRSPPAGGWKWRWRASTNNSRRARVPCAARRWKSRGRRFSLGCFRMKIATWNVNGIRAREAQCGEWIEREQPDVALPAGDQGDARQVPPRSASSRATGATGTARRRYSGVACTCARSFPERPRSPIPPSTTRTASSSASSAASRRVGLRAQRRQGLSREAAVPRGAGGTSREPRAAGGTLVLCGDMNVARTDQRRASRRSASRARSASVPRSARSSSGSSAAGLVDVGRALDPDNDRALHLVGAVAQHAPAQHRLAHRLRPGERDPGGRERRSVLADVGTSDHAPVIVEFS